MNGVARGGEGGGITKGSYGMCDGRHASSALWGWTMEGLSCNYRSPLSWAEVRQHVARPELVREAQVLSLEAMLEDD